jgi:primosomal protein N' (replication factor Y)
MRQELKDGNRSIFSQRLQNALEQVFADKQQAILFLNRRGSATFVFCRDCGYSLKCPRCETPLTYHQMAPHPEPVLVCHYCNYQRKPPRACPSCRGNHIRQFGTGTERVESEILSMFPNLRTLRWDAETTRHKGAHETIMAQFSAHRADVLIGTQMLAKGLDLPLVTLVGVVLADVGLNLPDYRAAERTFQVLTQVAGRAGRSLLGGQVVLQTFQPDHYAIQAAASHDFRAFYQKEMEYRRRLGYPPYTQLVRLEYRHQYFNKAEMAAQSLASQIRQWIEAEDRRATQMIGPTPCFFSRIAGWYRWQIILRGPNPVSLLRGRQINDWRIEENPQNLL